MLNNGFLLLFFAILMLLSPRAVFAQHVHCDQYNWGPISSSNTYPEVPADYTRSRLNVFMFKPILNVPPPPSSRPDCNYEISDITQIDITLEFTGTMTWKQLDVFAGPSFARQKGTFTFQKGQTWYFQFPAHPDTGALTVDMKNTSGPIQVDLLGNNHSFSIEYASITLHGHHYYVPEPDATAWLLSGGLACCLSLLRLRRHKA